jgi:L,D-peptidoglycan transpeptidase YkuD (ErfK/YbiS/YcfS/YnhG family)
MKWIKYIVTGIMLSSIGSYAAVPKVFEKILELNKARIGNSGQIMLVTNKVIGSIEVTIRTFEKNNGQWVETFASTMGTIGESGFAPYKEKIEGDGKTPTGIFFLGPVYSYPEAKVSTKMEYWVASKNDFWFDDVNSPQYNRWVTSKSDPKNDGISRELMKRPDGKYKYGICVQYNMDQIKGKGSVITVHVLEGKQPTLGCIAIKKDELIDIIGWLDPAKKPLIITGTEVEQLSKPVSGAMLDKNDKHRFSRQ